MTLFNTGRSDWGKVECSNTSYIRRQRVFATALSAVAMLCCAMVKAPGQTASWRRKLTRVPLKIGYIIPLSGQSAEPGHKIVNGMQLYLDQVHNRMGGRKVDVIIENDESSPATAIAKVHKLVQQDHVQLLTGMFLSNCLYAIAPVVENYKIPFLVNVSAGADDLTQRKRSKWIVRTCYTGSQPSHPFGEYAAKTMGLKRVVTIASDYAYGYEVVGGFQQSFEENGGKVVQKLWTPLGFKDFSDIIKSIHPAADAVFMCVVGQSAEIVPKQFKEMGPKLPLIGLTASFDESFYPRMGDELNGAVSASLYSTALSTPANQRFVKEYRAKYGEDPSYFSEHGYTAMKFLDKALGELKGNLDDKEKVLAALRKVELKDAPRGPVRIDEYGSSVDNIYVRKVERKNKNLQNTVIFTYPMVSQFWKYDPETYMKQPAYTKDYPPCKNCDKQ